MSSFRKILKIFNEGLIEIFLDECRRHAPSSARFAE